MLVLRRNDLVSENQVFLSRGLCKISPPTFTTMTQIVVVTTTYKMLSESKSRFHDYYGMVFIIREH